MSTRSSTAATTLSQQSSSHLKTDNSQRRSLKAAAENPNSLKEKSKSHSQSGRSETAAKKGRKKEMYCTCRGTDDGTPMIFCSLCTEWYHFNCIGLSERDAEEIDVFVCSPCKAQTGLQTVREWEGRDALEQLVHPVQAEDDAKLEGDRSLPKAVQVEAIMAQLEESESDDDPSSDEYVAEDASRARQPGKRRLRRLSTSSNSSQASDGERRTATKRAKLSRPSRRIHTSSSPAPLPLKRKQSNASEAQPSKKQKSGTNGDPTRRYCLGKLEEIFCQIFLKYPYFHDVSEGQLDLQSHFTKTTADLTDDEKVRLEEKAKEYAKQVEHSVFETYSEPDKSGRPAAAGKYKERFRMLDFNLKKPDRIVLHKRIVSSTIPPGALSLMSSTDLASEEEKQSIKLAEQESLAHSILNKPTVPRAKITHKGLQDIEDVNGELAVRRDAELEREQEEEERRDRERTARLRAAGASGSAPPDLPPAVTDNPTWGAPQLASLHTLQQDHSPIPLSQTEQSPPSPLFFHSASNPAVQHQVEGELNLADLINIDEDTSQEVGVVEPSATPVSENSSPVTATDEKKDLVVGPSSPTSLTSPSTGISPFAVNVSKPDTTTRPSFDLSSVWSAPKAPDDKPPLSPPALPVPEEPKDPIVDTAFFGEEADDKDFDMFLEKDYQDNEAGLISEGPRKPPGFNDFPQVWKGSLHMPLDSTIPQDVAVVARQMGGRTMESDSPLWNVLFPSENLRIDGRVPVVSSSQYLLQMRMNSVKELVAVAFSPPSESESLAFNFLMDHLLGKNRHGLIFPWGARPKDHHPGRELYVIPLLSSDPLPDYMELLDSLRLPAVRAENYLVGIFILNKGKLTLPPASNQNSVPAPVQFGPPHLQLPILHSTPPPVPPPPSSIPTIPLGNPLPQPPPPPVPVTSAALAAEVASLTPDQIQRVLQSLSAAGTSVPAILQQQIQQQQQPPLLTPPQPWSNTAPPAFAPFPPHAHSAVSQSPPQPPYSRAPPPQAPHDQYDHYERDLSDRGRRGGWSGRSDRGGGRGRGGAGRGGGRGDRPRDSGWPKRGGRGSSSSGWGGERSWT